MLLPRARIPSQRGKFPQPSSTQNKTPKFFKECPFAIFREFVFFLVAPNCLEDTGYKPTYSSGKVTVTTSGHC